MESVRLATSADLQRCTELLHAAREEVLAARGGALFLESRREPTGGTDAPFGSVPELSRCLEQAGDPQANCRVFVGQFEGVVVGLAVGLVEEPAVTAGRAVGRIAGCYVEQQAREVGVGAALIDELVRWFTERGCGGVEALALPGDRSTKQLFETSGLKARLLVMYRELS